MIFKCIDWCEVSDIHYDGINIRCCQLCHDEGIGHGYDKQGFR